MSTDSKVLLWNLFSNSPPASASALSSAHGEECRIDRTIWNYCQLDLISFSSSEVTTSS